jgi:hypothetical protein
MNVLSSYIGYVFEFKQVHKYNVLSISNVFIDTFINHALGIIVFISYVFGTHVVSNYNVTNNINTNTTTNNSSDDSDGSDNSDDCDEYTNTNTVATEAMINAREARMKKFTNAKKPKKSSKFRFLNSNLNDLQ